MPPYLSDCLHVSVSQHSIFSIRAERRLLISSASVSPNLVFPFEKETMEMDAETKRRIEEAVLEVLNGVDMDEASEYTVRAAASERLGIDLSAPDCKRLVRRVVESFIQSKRDEREEGEKETREERNRVTGAGAEAEAAPEEEEEDEEEEEEDTKKRRGEKEYDDEGNLIVCRLSNKRRVTIQEFRGKTLVSIREYYEKGGKELPSSKGISLTVEQWEAFSKAVPAIEDAIKKLDGSD